MVAQFAYDNFKHTFIFMTQLLLWHNLFPFVLLTKRLHWLMQWLSAEQAITSPEPVVIMFTDFHDDVIKWKHFRVTGPLCGEFTGPGEFPTQRPVTRSFDVFFDLRLNKRLNKQRWGWWFETPSWPLLRQCNVWRKVTARYRKRAVFRSFNLC